MAGHLFRAILLVVTMTTPALGGIVTPSDMVASNEVEVTVTPSREKRSTGGPHERFDMVLDVGGVPVKKSLDLIATHQDVDMYELDGDDVVPVQDFTVKRDWATYGSPEADAAMIVKHHPKHGPRMEGTIRHDDRDYYLQPVDNSNRHVLHTIDRGMRFDPPKDSMPAHIKEKIRNKRDSPTYEIELMMVFDHHLYKRFKTITPPGESTEEVMKEYYGLLINEINVRYQSMRKDYKLDLRVIMGGLIIDTDNSVKPYATRMGGDGYAGSPLLNSFNEWVNKKFPDIDDVQIHVGEKFEGNLLGLAFYFGVCGKYSAGIVTNDLNYRSTHTAAHELGHNMDMAHDAGAHCSNTYIMYPMALRLLGKSTPRNAWHFSHCSYVDATNFIKELDKTNKNCLVNRTAKHSLSSKYGKKLPGVGLTYDQVCNMSIPGSQHCTGKQYGYKSEDVCLGIICRDPDNADDCIQRYVPPGTPCGDFKICRRGVCSENKKLGVKKNEKCLFGDSDSDLRYNRMVTNCKEAMAKGPRWCLPFEKECCQSCEKLRKTDSGICRYGEGRINVRINQKNYHDCPSAVAQLPGTCYSNYDQCCESCPKYIKEHPTSGYRCRYGDHLLPAYGLTVNYKNYFTCTDAVAAFPGVCYSRSAKLCCASCKKAEKSGSCKFGDYPGNVVYDQHSVSRSCAKVIPDKDNAWACYNSQGADKCCGSCKKYERDDRYCKYGDKLIYGNGRKMKCRDYIRSKDDAAKCYQSRHNYDCCVTCAKYKTNIRNCDFGDHSGRYHSLDNRKCDVVMTKGGAAYCYNHEVRRKCCESCSKRKTSDYGSSCQYGDKKGRYKGKEVDCAGIFAADPKKCDEYNFKRLCCATCYKKT